jgi:hypothetical protein
MLRPAPANDAPASNVTLAPATGTVADIVIKAVGAATTSMVWVLVRTPPALSVTVRLTTTVPAALVANTAVAVLLAPVKLAKLAPLMIAHW